MCWGFQAGAGTGEGRHPQVVTVMVGSGQREDWHRQR
jgi:hypothetical protein